MKKIDFNRHIWEGWTVGDFISELEPQIQTIMDNGSWRPAFKNRDDLKKWCMDNQPYYKKYIPDMMRLDNAWQSPCPISKKDNGGDREFDARVNEFMYYNCDNERGRGVKYFVEQFVL